MKRRACVVTASRSEYGLLRWIMTALRDNPAFELVTIVTGAHLSPEYGSTYHEIESDGFIIDATIEILLSSNTAVGIAKSMGLCALGIADAYARIKPDFIIILGDRYELLPVCSTALVMRIPIVHISGGDITEGAIDNEIRNAVTQMASLHFPGTKETAKHLESLGVPKDKIVVTGEPGLDNFKKMIFLQRPELAKSLGLCASSKWILLTYHPETKKKPKENIAAITALVEALLAETDAEIVATYANADEGGRMINLYLDDKAKKESKRLKVYKSLGQQRYISLIKESVLIAGNSSSGIVEAPLVGVPVLNIGDRQKGRHLCENIVSCVPTDKKISEAIRTLVEKNFPRYKPDMYYGDGTAAEQIVSVLDSRLADW